MLGVMNHAHLESTAVNANLNVGAKTMEFAIRNQENVFVNQGGLAQFVLIAALLVFGESVVNNVVTVLTVHHVIMLMVLASVNQASEARRYCTPDLVLWYDRCNCCLCS